MEQKLKSAVRLTQVEEALSTKEKETLCRELLSYILFYYTKCIPVKYDGTLVRASWLTD